MTLSLPDEIADEARKQGLLEPAAIEVLVREELKRRESKERWARIDKLRDLPGEQPSNEEIEAEIDAARVERRLKNEGRR